MKNFTIPTIKKKIEGLNNFETSIYLIFQSNAWDLKRGKGKDKVENWIGRELDFLSRRISKEEKEYLDYTPTSEIVGFYKNEHFIN